jgi:hypothetical protein
MLPSTCSDFHDSSKEAEFNEHGVKVLLVNAEDLRVLFLTLINVLVLQVE